MACNRYPVFFTDEDRQAYIDLVSEHLRAHDVDVREFFHSSVRPPIDQIRVLESPDDLRRRTSLIF